MWIDVDWFGDTGLFDLGGDIWQLTPDGMGGFIATPFDPIGDLAAGFLMPIIMALPIIGMVMVGAPLVIALAAALLGLLAYLLVGSLLHPIAGFGLFSTCLVYALGTLSWAICDMFETHNPIFLFGYIGLAALVLIVWVGLGSFAEGFDDASGFPGVIVAVGGLIVSAILFFTASGESRATYSVYAFRIMHYLVLACLAVGVLMRIVELVRSKGNGGTFSVGALAGCGIAFALGLIPLVVTALLGTSNAIVTCCVFVVLYVAVVVLAPSVGASVKASPVWALMPLFLGSCLYLVAESASGVLIRTDVADALIAAVLENPLLASLRHMTASVLAAFSGPVTNVCNALADFIAGLFDHSWPDFPVASCVVIAVMLAVACGALMLGATLRSSLAKQAK